MTVDLLTPFTKVELEPKIISDKPGIGLFWGNFNPVHLAHLIIADQVRQQLHLNSVRFLPENPTKEILKMLKFAIEGETNLEIEQARCGAKCNILATLQDLKKQEADAELYFIIGGDMVSGLNHWPHIDVLMELVTFVGVQRPRYRSGTSYPILWVDCPQMDFSSSQIRAQLAKNITPNFLVPPKVLDYIKKEGLYRNV